MSIVVVVLKLLSLPLLLRCIFGFDFDRFVRLRPVLREATSSGASSGRGGGESMTIVVVVVADDDDDEVHCRC